jgi:hypothetical protein
MSILEIVQYLEKDLIPLISYLVRPMIIKQILYKESIDNFDLRLFQEDSPIVFDEYYNYLKHFI